MKLIILNGPSGIGKSTISRKLASEIPGTVILDIDEMRRAIPDYKERREESSRQVYIQAKEEIARHLMDRHDVIVDKAVLNSEPLDSLIEEGRRQGAEVYEFLLWADKETTQKRADERGYIPGSLLMRERVGEMWDSIDRLRIERPEAITIDTTGLSPEATGEKIMGVLGR